MSKGDAQYLFLSVIARLDLDFSFLCLALSEWVTRSSRLAVWICAPNGFAFAAPLLGAAAFPPAGALLGAAPFPPAGALLGAAPFPPAGALLAAALLFAAAVLVLVTAPLSFPSSSAALSPQVAPVIVDGSWRFPLVEVEVLGG